jgi:hypothetical protein
METIACCGEMLNPAAFGEEVLITGLAFAPGCRITNPQRLSHYGRPCRDRGD